MGLVKGAGRFVDVGRRKLFKPLNSYLSAKAYSPAGEEINLMENDWDTVILLDACRYDLFEGANTIDGDLGFRISPGSATPEFLTASFEGRQFHDTVYVTANPIYRTKDLGAVFHEVIDVWEDHWNDEFQTVMPAEMTEATIDAHERYPQKRIIAHFLQPHYPFIGDLRDEIPAHAGAEATYRQATGGEERRNNRTVWQLLKANEISRELAWSAYEGNLSAALPHVERAIDALSGRIVVTSDHGNLLGERIHPLSRRMYGHPTGIKHEHLRKVPWLVVEKGQRRRVGSEVPSERSSEVTGTVSDRLADLGYVDA